MSVKTNQLQQFRNEVYQNFNNCKRTDTRMDLVDALCSNTTAKTAVELTLNPHFRRPYSALNKAVQVHSISDEQLSRLTAKMMEAPGERSFQGLGIDVTAHARPYADTLKDRGFVYQPNTLKGNQPIAIGHPYSFVCLLPERDKEKMGNWVLPLAMKRVGSQENKEMVGAQQVAAILNDEALPFGKDLCVEVADSAYRKPAYLNANRDKQNFVSIVRARGTRTFYRQPEQIGSPKPGRPAWYGTPFYLKVPDTWSEPDEVTATPFVSHKKISYRLEIQAWSNLLMRGGKNLPMHPHPFTLVKIRLHSPMGKVLFQKPLWLMVMGDRRIELSLLDIYQADLQRYDLEHFFRFGKQKLLLDKFQTPDDEHEEHGWRLVALAYLQLWVAKDAACHLPRPWEQYLSSDLHRQITPAMVLRNRGRIIRQIGTPAPAPKRRGNSPGRRKGAKLTPRKRQPVMKKNVTFAF